MNVYEYDDFLNKKMNYIIIGALIFTLLIIGLILLVLNEYLQSTTPPSSLPKTTTKKIIPPRPIHRPIQSQPQPQPQPQADSPEEESGGDSDDDEVEVGNSGKNKNKNNNNNNNNNKKNKNKWAHTNWGLHILPQGRTLRNINPTKIKVVMYRMPETTLKQYYSYEMEQYNEIYSNKNFDSHIQTLSTMKFDKFPVLYLALEPASDDNEFAPIETEDQLHDDMSLALRNTIASSLKQKSSEPSVWIQMDVKHDNDQNFSTTRPPEAISLTQIQKLRNKEEDVPIAYDFQVPNNWKWLVVKFTLWFRNKKMNQTKSKVEYKCIISYRAPYKSPAFLEAINGLRHLIEDAGE